MDFIGLKKWLAAVGIDISLFASAPNISHAQFLQDNYSIQNVDCQKGLNELNKISKWYD